MDMKTWIERLTLRLSPQCGAGSPARRRASSLGHLVEAPALRQDLPLDRLPERADGDERPLVLLRVVAIGPPELGPLLPPHPGVLFRVRLEPLRIGFLPRRVPGRGELEQTLPGAHHRVPEADQWHF